MPKCEHLNKRIVWSAVNASGEAFEGGRQLRHQCLQCGKLLPNHLAHRFATPDTPDVDVAALKRHREVQEQEWRERWVDRQAEFDAEQQRRREAYHEYLETPEWWEKREAVMERENNICQGCRAARAVHVHHLTYDHCGAEFLWELVAICEGCHERAHGRKFD